MFHGRLHKGRKPKRSTARNVNQINTMVESTKFQSNRCGLKIQDFDVAPRARIPDCATPESMTEAKLVAVLREGREARKVVGVNGLRTPR